MKRPAFSVKQIACGVIEHETANSKDAPALAAAIEGVFAALEGLMATLIGPTGFRAVVDRAVHLTNGTWPWIQGTEILTSAQLIITGPAPPSGEAEGIARVNANVIISGLPSIIEHEGEDQVKAGAAALLENLLQLFCSFIGEDLTLRVVMRAWPYLPQLPAASRSEESES